MVETTLHDACSDMLEAAVVDGRLAPGSTRLKTAQRRLIDQWLDDPLPEDDEGRSPRELIEWERLKRWLGPHPGGPARSIPPDVRARLGELFRLRRQIRATSLCQPIAPTPNVLATATTCSARPS